MWVNNNVYIFDSMTLKTTHVRSKGGYNGWMTLKVGRCVRVRYLRMCAKFRSSRVNSLGENPFGGVSIFVTLDISSKFLPSC